VDKTIFVHSSLISTESAALDLIVLVYISFTADIS